MNDAGRDLVLADPNPAFPSQTELGTMQRMAEMLVASRLLPPVVNTPEKALLIIQKGRELGLPPAYALSNIHIIEGKPSLSAEAMMALVKTHVKDGHLVVAETNDQYCRVLVKHDAWPGDIFEVIWNLARAKQAGLTSKATWQKYPAAMLRSRAVSEACRAHFPEAIAGCYTPEELGAPVEVDPTTGEITVIEGQAREIPHPDELGLLRTMNSARACIESAMTVAHLMEAKRLIDQAETWNVAPPPEDLLTLRQLLWDRATHLHQGGQIPYGPSQPRPEADVPSEA